MGQGEQASGGRRWPMSLSVVWFGNKEMVGVCDGLKAAAVLPPGAMGQGGSKQRWPTDGALLLGGLVFLASSGVANRRRWVMGDSNGLWVKVVVLLGGRRIGMGDGDGDDLGRQKRERERESVNEGDEGGDRSYLGGDRRGVVDLRASKQAVDPPPSPCSRCRRQRWVIGEGVGSDEARWAGKRWSAVADEPLGGVVRQQRDGRRV
ncbi:hypothetical protein Dimus_033299 [Dionaea muscipula]